MLPKFGQFKSKAKKNSDRIDANRGYGTYSAITQSDVDLAKSGAAGAFKKMGYRSPADARSNFERKQNTEIPGVKNAWKGSSAFPGAHL